MIVKLVLERRLVHRHPDQWRRPAVARDQIARQRRVVVTIGTLSSRARAQSPCALPRRIAPTAETTSHTSMPLLPSIRSVCLTPCFLSLLVTRAYPRPIAWIDNTAASTVPITLFASDNTRIACKSSPKIFWTFAATCSGLLTKLDIDRRLVMPPKPTGDPRNSSSGDRNSEALSTAYAPRTRGSIRGATPTDVFGFWTVRAREHAYQNYRWAGRRACGNSSDGERTRLCNARVGHVRRVRLPVHNKNPTTFHERFSEHRDRRVRDHGR